MVKNVDLKAAEQRVRSMEQERSSFDSQYKSLSKLFLPFRGRFHLGDNNKGERKDKEILNNTPLIARRVLSAGIMSGVTSPSQKWFRLTTGDQNVDRAHDAAKWLFDVAEIMYRVFAMSNLYNQLQSFYNEIGTFGTAAMGVYADDQNIIRFETQTVGQYAVGAGINGEIDSLSIRQKRQVVSIVKEFGKENCPEKVLNMWENGQLTQEVEFIRLVEPNDDRAESSPFNFDKPYRSISWIAGTKPNEEPLSVKGFDEFPFMVTRWDIAPGDLYGTSCPGMVALGDAKGLQLAEKDLLTAMDQIANPPTVASQELRRTVGDRGPEPGRTYFADDVEQGIKSLYDTQPNINGMAENVNRFEERVSDAFFKDLFLMLAGQQDESMTATEVIARQEEKMLQLGPVLERMHNELLDPLITRAFHILQKKGFLPDPPESLIGQNLSVEYVSVMAQAQKLTGVKGLERLSTFAANMAAVDPKAAMTLDITEIIAKYAEAVGVDPDVLTSKEEVQEQIQSLRAAQTGQNVVESAQQAAEAAKTASEAGYEGDTVLSRLSDSDAVSQALRRLGYGGGNG